MANGEGIAEEVLVRGRADMSEVEKAIPASVDKGVAAAQTSFDKFTASTKMSVAQMVNLGKALKAGGANAQDLITVFKEGKASTEDMRTAFGELGYTAEDLGEVLKETEKGYKRMDWSARGMGKAIEWATYRFVTALAIYMLFRKVIRAIDEAIKESIRLFKEYTQQQQVLKANLEINNQLLQTQVGTLKEWNDFIAQSSKTFGGTKTVWAEATNTALEYNTTLGLTNEELQHLITLGMAVAQMWGVYKEGQLDVASGVKTVMDAIRGQEAAMLKLGIKEEDIAAKAGLSAAGFRELTDAQQENARWSYIMEERYEIVGNAAVEGMTDTERATLKAVTANNNLYVAFGRFIAMAKERSRVIQIIARFAVDTTIELTEATKEATRQIMEEIQALAQLRLGIERLRGVLKTFEDIGASARDTLVGYYQGLSDAWRDYQQGATDLTKQETEERLRLEEEYQQDVLNLEERYGEQRQDLIDRATKSIANLRKNAAKRESQDKDDRAQEERQREEKWRNEERQAEERWRNEEAQRQQDLNLTLKQAEEDHLLDMKQLRDQFTMDLEEAARTRDAVTIRALQRRYGLEKKQREENYSLARRQSIEDYELQRKQRQADYELGRKQREEDYRLALQQFIESWDARHAENQANLEQEIKEVRDNLALELAALEDEKIAEKEKLDAAHIKEMDDLRTSFQQRQNELAAQYNQQREDLKTSLAEQLVALVSGLYAQGEITKGQAEAITGKLAEQYGLNAGLMASWVALDMLQLDIWKNYWDTTIKDILGYIKNYEDAIRSLAPSVQRGIEIPLPGGTSRGFAEGGMMVATAPTMVKVGEKGPELFGALPLGKLGGLGTGPMGMRGGMDIRLTIDGTQSGAWSGDFETQVLRVFRGILQESL